MTRVHRYWLLAPLMLCYWIDITLTLLGQQRVYWQGDYEQPSEANPIARVFLRQSPWLFLGLAVVWAGLFFGVVMCWKHRTVRWAAIILTILHAVGGSSWLFRLESWGWAWAIGYLVLMAQFSKWCWRRSAWFA